MNLVSTINFLLIAGVIQGFLFNIVTLFIKKRYTKVIIYLNFTVLFLSLNNLQRWLAENDFSSNNFFIKQLEVPWYVLMFPFFFLFLVHFLKVEDKVRDYLKLTLTIFVLEVIVRLSLITYVYYNVPDQDDSIIKYYHNYEEVVNLIYCLYIFAQSLILVYKKQDLYSYLLSYDDINWIKIFLKLGAVVFMFWVIAVGYVQFTGDRSAYLLLRFGTSILLYWIGYQGFYRYNVVKDRIVLRRTLAEQNYMLSTFETKNSVSTSQEFNTEKHKKEFDNISDFIISAQRFLDPYLSMEELSKDLGISVSHMSKLINSFSGHNFSDYINGLRVEQAKKLLADPDFSQYTIVSIGLESGFNSRSTFYAAFKKFTTQTPSQFRDSNL